MPRRRAPKDKEYQALAKFRCELRGFLAHSENEARAIGVPPQQHQALLAIRGAIEPGRMAVTDLADCLFIRHHTAVELVDRMVERGLLVREDDPQDRRRNWLALTPQAHEVLQKLSEAHVEEVKRIAPMLKSVLEQLS